MKLAQKIIIYFVLAILLSIFIVSLISNSILKTSFDKYLVSEQENTLIQVSEEINQLYKDNDYELYEQQIYSYASLENLNIKIKNLEDEIIYSSEGRQGMKRQNNIHNAHKKRMASHGMNLGKYLEKDFPLYKNGEVAGFIVIGYIDNSYLTESALVFKDTLTKILIISGIVALTIGVLASVFLAKGLTRPLIDIGNTALEIQKGNLSTKSQIKTNTIEINQLSNSINYLGETLLKQEGIRKRYASDVSHELRTPISTLKSHIEAIIDGVWEPTDEHLSILMIEVDRLSSLVNDLQSSFSSSEHGVILNKTHFNLSDEINNVITTFIPIFKRESIYIEKNIEDNILIHMDKDKLKQVVYNLLSNSSKYTGKNGKIWISLERSYNNKVIIKIKDNGIGIKKEDLPFLFHRFYRVDKSRGGDTGGTGLGLSIVKSIIDAHNGEIDVESEYGIYTEIIITLPLE